MAKLNNKTFFLDQHGCAKNQVDGELIVSRLQKLGMTMVSEPEKADLILINSCGFIKSAKEESIASLMDARDAYPGAKILLAGCLAERYASTFKTELPEADGIFGNGDLAQIDSVVNSMFDGERPVVKPEQQGVCCGDRNLLLNYKGTAYVKITEGCDNRCTFCAIPLIRGSLRSRPAKDIVSEIKTLVESGTKEINLIGQDLAAYGCGKNDDVFDDGTNSYNAIYRELKEPICTTDDWSEKYGGSCLLRLMKEISAVQGDFWVRLLYIHPDHFNPDILSFMKQDSRFLPYFDIPFQSGSTRVIRAMNRKGSYESYTKLIRTIRSAFPESCIRTTFLTGFPTETDEEALETERFLQEVKSDWSGCFTYSTEDDTPAARLKGKVKPKTAKARADSLQILQAQITRERLSMRTGKTYSVLIEEIVQNNDGTDEGLAIARAWFEAPEVDGNVVVRYDLDDPRAVDTVKPGSLVKVRAFASSDIDLDAELVLD